MFWRPKSKIGHEIHIYNTDRNFGFGPVPVPVEFGPVPVLVDLAGTGPVPGQERVFKIAKRTDEYRYSLNSENVEMLVTFHELNHI